jgi:diaminohydroxyphosphoribosylaminopyrimidine deaminase/5-amino-6-(5-phosphoribosylamino)uracil reductase
VGLRDPHPLVSGRGLRRLRRRGVAVRVGVLPEACRDHHRGFLSVCERGRPWVVLKLASTLDGRIATSSGESQWISGARSRAFVHGLRASSDAVMVGSGTALADDPALTARRGERVVHAPVRVLVDSRLRVPTSARLYQESRGEAWVLCGRGVRGRKARSQVGARVLEVRRRGRGLDLAASLERLAQEGLTQILVEGGGQLAASLLRSHCLDEIHWIVAPRLIGGDGQPALGPLGLRSLSESDVFESVEVSRLGDDVRLTARVAKATGKR